MLNAKLIVVGGDAKASEVQLRLPTVIGRGREVTLTLPHPLVSRRHTEIFEQDGQLFVRDLGSLNGTFVNSQRIQEAQPLGPDQLLTLGNVTFRAVYEVADLASSDQLESKITMAVELKPGIADVCEQQKLGLSATSPLNDSGKSLATVDVEPLFGRDDQVGDETSGSVVIADRETAEDQGEANGPLVRSGGTTGSGESIDASVIAGLPAAASSASFVGDIEIEGGAAERSGVVDPVQLDLDGQSQGSAVDPESSGLGSFLKKLPR